MKYSDVELIDLVKQGDEAAFEELYQRFHKLAYFFANKMCKNDADAKDVVQDTFIEIHRSITSLKENTYFKSWMYKIVNSKCKRIFRKSKYTTTDVESDIIINELREAHIEFVPEQFIHFHSDKEVLDHMIRELPEAQRAIVILFYLEQMSLQEISDALEVPLGTVKSRLSYGRTYLRRAMQEYHRVQGDTLSFHELDAIIASCMAASCIQKALPYVFGKGNAWRSLLQKHMLVNSVVFSVSFVVIVAGIGGYQVWKHAQDHTPQEVSKLQVKEEQAREFQPINIHGRIIDTAQDAYFTLMSWACCEEAIQEKSKDEVLQYATLYNEMKEYGGPYYEQLKGISLSSSLENLQ